MCHVSPPSLVQLFVSVQLCSSRFETGFLLCGRTSEGLTKSPLQGFSHSLVEDLSHFYKCFCSQVSWRLRRDQNKLFTEKILFPHLCFNFSLSQNCSLENTFFSYLQPTSATRSPAMEFLTQS